jgi:hypothetical protein
LQHSFKKLSALKKKKNAKQCLATTESQGDEKYKKHKTLKREGHKRQTNKSVGARFCSLMLENFTWKDRECINSIPLFCNLFSN